MNPRTQYDYVDLIPMPENEPESIVFIEAAFIFRDYASVKTIFGTWVQMGYN